MEFSPRRLLAAFVAMLSFGASLAKSAGYNEFVDGDLHDVVTNPSTLSLEPGSNILVAEASSIDVDLLHVVVPSGRTLDSIELESHVGVIRVFAAIQSGAVWTAGVGHEIDEENLYGWLDFPFDIDPGHEHEGEELLAAMGQAPGSIGFSPPLASGDYALLFQTQSSAAPFALDFRVSGGANNPTDFNGDSVVNGADLSDWKSAITGTGSADADLDGDADGADFLAWQQNVSAPSGAVNAASVPEPASLLLAAASLTPILAVEAWRRGRHHQEVRYAP